MNWFRIREEGTSPKKPGANFLFSSPPGNYSNNIKQDLAVICGLKQPSKLPPHLERALLNCRPIGNDTDQLPLPHRVMINHIYERPSNESDVAIFGLTRRYKDKYVTTVYYKKAVG